MARKHIQTGYFGKVPAYADFIRYHAGGAEVYQMDQWFQEALHFASTSLGGQWREEYRRGPIYRLVFHPDGSERCIVGVCIPSEDKGGRAYPFSVFAIVDHAHIQPDPIMVPIIFSTFLDRAEEVATHGWQDGDQNQLIFEVEGLCSSISEDPTPYRSSYREALEKQTCHRFWSDLFGTCEDVRKYVLFEHLVEWMRPFRNTDLRFLRAGLRYPLAPRIYQPEYQVAFWIELTFHLVGAKVPLPTLFWSTCADGCPSLFLFFRQPSPRSYVHFIRPEMKSDSVWDLLADEGEYSGETHSRLQAEHRTCLDDPSLSLAGFLRKAGQSLGR